MKSRSAKALIKVVVLKGTVNCTEESEVLACAYRYSRVPRYRTRVLDIMQVSISMIFMLGRSAYA